MGKQPRKKPREARAKKRRERKMCYRSYDRGETPRQRRVVEQGSKTEIDRSKEVWKEQAEQLLRKGYRKLYEENSNKHSSPTNKGWLHILHPSGAPSEEIHNFRRVLCRHPYLYKKLPAVLVEIIRQMIPKVPLPSEETCRRVYYDVEWYSNDDRLADIRHDTAEARIKYLISVLEKYPDAAVTISTLKKMLFICEWFFKKGQKRLQRTGDL